KTSREFVGSDLGGAGELLALAEADEVILPGRHFAARIDSRFQVMETGRTIMIVRHVVFASPQEFHGLAHLLGDGGGLKRVVIGQAASKTATDFHQMPGDVLRRNAEYL